MEKDVTIEKEESKKIVFSGIQPSGNLTIANYLGAIKFWVKNQDLYNNIFSIVDMHAITVRQDPQELRRRTLELAAIYIAAGINQDKSTIFIQSHVPQHAELSWILTCNSYMGEMSRMTQYKLKTQSKEGESIEAGLFSYPILMAADILLYQTDMVPVGEDQIQHVELTRNIAQRFNHIYSDTFKIPEYQVSKSGARIKDLQYPEKKMSKSEVNPNSAVRIMDTPDDIRRKISRAVTDSVGIVNYTEDQPGVMNLINILSAVENKTPDAIVAEFKGLGYKEFKEAIGEALIKELSPVQDKVKELLKDNKTMLEGILREGALKAQYMANKTLRKVYKKVGFVPFFKESVK